MKEVSEETVKCKCGCESFYFGDDISFVQDHIVCKCGNDKFDFHMHLNHTNKSVYNYTCSKCKKTIGKEIYREITY